jgi:predicted nucleic acid-binding protein
MNPMSDKTFVDTNILICAHDADSGEKQRIAKRLLSALWSERAGVLSMQVLEEFYVSVTQNVPSPLPKDLARLVVTSYAIWCQETTPKEITAAFRIEDESQIGFRNALIVSSAAQCGASRIWSEDMDAGRRIAGVLIENPFAGRI